jgi:hypothetical protein
MDRVLPHPHALVFGGRRISEGWIKAQTRERVVIVSPLHRRLWASSNHVSLSILPTGANRIHHLDDFVSK